MDDRVMQFRVGVVVLATLLIAGILLVLFDEVPTFGFGKKIYKIDVHFDSAPGVSKGTPVRKSGILIGRVSDLRFADDGGAVVTINIDDEVKINREERCRLRANFIGDASLEFFRMDQLQNPDDYLQAGDVIQNGVVFSDPMQVLQDISGDMKSSLDSIAQAGKDVSELATNMNKIINDKDGNIAKAIKKMESSLNSFETVMDDVHTVIGDKKVQENLRESLKDLPQMMTQIKETLDQFQNTVKLADDNLKNLKGFTEPLGKNGEEMIKNANASVANLEELLAQMVKFSKALNSEEGSLGQLIHNPDLYQNLNRATRNVEEASKMLKPIMRDVRLFADTLNRHPGKILRDAVKPGPGTKGFSREGNHRLLNPQNRTQQPTYYHESQRRNNTYQRNR